MKFVKIFLIIICTFGSLPFSANSHESTPLWECRALGENVGKHEPNYSSDLMRWSDGRFRIIERGVDYYTSDNPENVTNLWLQVFATARGHGNTLIGMLKKENFECKRYQD